MSRLRYAPALLLVLACEPPVEPGVQAVRVASPDAASVASLGASADSAALAALYEATGGPDWRFNENWLTAAPVGEWYGVTVSGVGRVIQLDLSHNGLTGQIPSELGNLAALQELHLHGNHGLTGQIPSELGNLAALQELWLSSNGLTGPIPPELGNLAGLKRLDLSGGLTGPIPAELWNLAALESLSLPIDGPIPPELRTIS